MQNLTLHTSFSLIEKKQGYLQLLQNVTSVLRKKSLNTDKIKEPFYHLEQLHMLGQNIHAHEE